MHFGYWCRMQDRGWNDTLPLSLLIKEACPPGGVSLEGAGGVASGTPFDGEVYFDSMADLESGDGDFPELSAFLSQDEINLSLDLAQKAMSDAGDPNDLDEPPVPTEHLPLYSETKNHILPDSTLTQTPPSADAPSGKVTSRSGQPSAAPESPEKFVCQKSITPVYKQDRPRLVHGGLELNERAASTSEFCSRAATFIEELSSIFKGSTRGDHQGDEDSSSPDSGYLSPRSHRLAMQQAQVPSSSSSSSEPQQEAINQDQAGVGSDVAESQGQGVSLDGPMAPPRFTQKLKSQEVAEGSPIRLECRVTGNPLPLVRYNYYDFKLIKCLNMFVFLMSMRMEVRVSGGLVFYLPSTKIQRVRYHFSYKGLAELLIFCLITIFYQTIQKREI